MKLSLATLAVTSVLAFNAQAQSFSTFGGQHEEVESAAEVVPFGAFDNSYSFSLANPLSTFSSAVALNNGASRLISEGMVFLFRDEVTDPDFLVGSFNFDGATGDDDHLFGPLLSGNYFYQVTGNAVGPLGGFYTVSSTLAPVPEPQTYALLLAGLGVIGFLARRRRPQA